MDKSNRPYIICHMMCTIEGKITSGTGVDILEDYFNIYTKVEDKLEAKVWMCGRVTMQMFAEAVNTPLLPANKEISEINFIAPFKASYFMIAVDTKGVLRWKNNSIKLSNVSEELHLVIVVTTKTPKDYLAYLQNKRISYIFAGNEEVDFAKLFKTLKEKIGVEKLLIEGGGLLNGSIMAADLIDEISLLVAPIVVNRTGAPSVFERRGGQKINIKRFKLVSAETVEKELVWLRYKRL